MSVRSIGVQFSGSAKIYAYCVNADEDVIVGDRVVVPTKIKDDGSVSLSIANVIEVHETWQAGAYMPIVQTILREHLSWAKSELERIAREGAAV